MAGLLVRNMLSPGDALCTTALARDLAQVQDRPPVAIETRFPEFFRHFPHLVAPAELVPTRKIFLDYRYEQGRSKLGHRAHFLLGFHQCFTRLTGIPVPLTTPKAAAPPIAGPSPVDGPYWLLVAGGKFDMVTKWWDPAAWWTVIDRLAALGYRFVQTGLNRVVNKTQHFQPVLRHPALLSVVDQGGPLDLLTLVKHAEGVLCPVTFAMHAAAAYDRPCVVVAGNREAWWYEAYINEPADLLGGSAVAEEFLRSQRPQLVCDHFAAASGQVAVPHRYLFNPGLLPCTTLGGCWRKQLVPLKPYNPRIPLCDRPYPVGAISVTPIAECLGRLEPERVVQAVLSYGPPAEKVAAPPRLRPGTPFRATAPAPKVQIQVPPAPPEAPRRPVAARQARPGLPRRPAAAQRPEGAIPAAWRGGETGPPLVEVQFSVVCCLDRDSDELAERLLGSLERYLPAALVPTLLCKAGTENLAAVRKRTWPVRVLGGTARYVALRQLLREGISSGYILWFDQESWVRHPQWLEVITADIKTWHPRGFRMYGHTTQSRVLTIQGIAARTWMASAAWDRRRPLQTATGREAPNGDRMRHTRSPFWALSLEAAQTADIPDNRLGESGGLLVLACQLWQHGYLVKDFDRPGQYVETPLLVRHKDRRV